MVFSSLTFLFLFLPIVIIFYYISRNEVKNYILLLFSLFFYAYGGVKYLYVMLFSIGINYIFGLLVHKTKEKPGLRKFILILAIICNLSVIGYYKYTDFFISNVNSIFNMDIKKLKIVMPIGISFFTFQALSYVIDVYRGHGKVQKNPFNVALYISLFPQLIAGPIVRYETVAEQIVSREETVDGFVYGIERFIFGLGKKVLLSNTMGVIADSVFKMNMSELVFGTAWIGAIAYTLQIYFDFSGYSDMAIGLGKIFGFDFWENFNYPYISKSVTEFWRRWHISLSTWFRDYVYIPLGGNRCSVKRHIINIFMVWFLTGMWHGASWAFIVWGLYYGVILILEKYVFKDIIKKMWEPLKHFYTLVLVVVGWVIFRAESLRKGLRFIKRMFFITGTQLIDNEGVFLLKEFKIEWIITIIATIPICKIIGKKYEEYKEKAENSKNDKMKLIVNVLYVLKHIYLAIVFALSIMFLVKSSFNPFIYFRF